MRAGIGFAALALILALASAAAGAAPPAAAVLVQGFSFQPPELTIAAGGAVTWTVGTDPEQHTVTPREAGAFEGSGQLFTGDTFTVMFNEPGTVEYFCSLHPNMVGTVEVSAESTPAASVPMLSPTTSPAAGEPFPAVEAGSGLPVLILAAVVGLGAVALILLLARRRPAP